MHLATGIFGFWQGKKAENVLVIFLTSGFAVFMPNTKTTILIMFFANFLVVKEPLTTLYCM